MAGDGPQIEGDGLRMKSVTPAKLTDFAAKIEAWQNADQAQGAALAAVPKATATRDAAAKALFEWMAEYKQFARTQFKDQPAIAQRLLL
jgi:cell pole-organizing protein PopZ